MLQNKYFEIMRVFLRGYHKEIYGSELIQEVFLSQKSIALTLIELEKQGILISKFSGNRKYYSLNLANPLILDYLILFEKVRKIRFLEKNKKLIDFSLEVDGRIVCVFGSYAKGRNTKNSDLDLLVVGKIDSLKLKKLGEKYGLNAQIFNLSMSDFRKDLVRNNLIVKECLNNHVLLRGEELFIREVLK